MVAAVGDDDMFQRHFLTDDAAVGLFLFCSRFVVLA